MSETHDKILIQSKDGISIYKIKFDGKRAVLKQYDEGIDKTEIIWYKKLTYLGVKTLDVLEYSTSHIVIEEISKSSGMRLGNVKDFSNKNIVGSIARAFKELHDKSSGTFDLALPAFIPQFQMEKIESVATKIDNEFITFIKNNYDHINMLLSSFPRVIIHRDFFYKNFAVDDNNEVILFDFNQMCFSLKSVELQFIRKVLRNHHSDSESLFLYEYGKFDKFEYALFEAYNHIDCLFYAFNQAEFPIWGEEALTYIKSSDNFTSFEKLLGSNLHK